MKAKRLLSLFLVLAVMLSGTSMFGGVLFAQAEETVPVITVDTYTNREAINSVVKANEYLYEPDSAEVAGIMAPFVEITNELIENGMGDTLINSFTQSNLILTNDAAEYGALTTLATKNAADDVYLTVLNRNSTEITATVNLEGYMISEDAQISMVALGGEIVSKTAALGVGDISDMSDIATRNSTFSYKFPGETAVTIKLSGLVDSSMQTDINAMRFGPWKEQYQVRHVNTPNIGSVPAWILVNAPLGTSKASIQEDPNPVVRPYINQGSRAFYMERGNTDIDVKISLSTQNFTGGNLPANFTKFGGFVKMVFDLKAGQIDNDAKLTYAIKSGDTTVFDLVLQNGIASCNGEGRFEYEADTWYQVEVVLNHDAGEYAVYMENNCLYNRNNYNNAVDPSVNLLECMYFTVDSGQGNFWFDNIRLLKDDTTITSKITQVEEIEVNTTSGTAPILPATVNAVYNTGESEARAVTWDEVDPSDYATQGTFTVNGTVTGLDISAKAIVTVASDIISLEPVNITIPVGFAPNLPNEVTATYADSSTGKLAVVWDTVDPSKYAQTGTFIVEGTVLGTTDKAVANVSVMSLTIVSIKSVNVTTKLGEAPLLPTKVTAVYDNESETEISVIWEAIPQSSYQSPGKFEVEGTVQGTAIKAVAEVSVTVTPPIITLDAYVNRATLKTLSQAEDYLYASGGANVTVDALKPQIDSALNEQLGRNVLNSFIQNNYMLNSEFGRYGALCLLPAADDSDSLYLTVLNRDTVNDITASLNLKNYTISGDLQVTAITATETVTTPVTLQTGESSFGYTFPANSLTLIKISGRSIDMWEKNFDLRHLNSQSVGAVPAWVAVSPSPLSSGTASVQDAGDYIIKPGVPVNTKAFLIKREGEDISMKATLSGQNVNPGTNKTYNGIVKIVFAIKAGQDDTASRYAINVGAGTDSVLSLVFENGEITCNGVNKGVYTKNVWYDVELILDHRANEYALYIDGKCLSYRDSYALPLPDADTNPLDYMYFNAVNADGSFYWDNLQAFSMDTAVTKKITRVEGFYQTVNIGTAPTLPTTVNAVYNTGEKLERTVSWAAVNPGDYAGEGTFNVIGTVEGTNVKATAVITVASLIGDVNGDGNIDVTDIMLVRDHILQISLLEGASLTRADVNGDDVITIADIIRLRKILLTA